MSVRFRKPVRLVTAGIETGGRIDRGALKLLEELAVARARSEPQALRAYIARAFRARLVTMISAVAQNALAATLVEDGEALLDFADGHAPLAVDLWLGDDQVA